MSQVEYKCQLCSAKFQRGDHLHRHKLSHFKPHFICAHIQCGMQFHRRDALKRHEVLHKSGGLKKRRKPRRGIIPHTRLSQQQTDSARPSTCLDHVSIRSSTKDPLPEPPIPSPVSDAGHTDPILSNCHQCEAVGMLCPSCMSPLLSTVLLGEDAQSMFQFCLQHFIRTHTEEFPFLHCSSLRTDWDESGKAFAMAAVSGCWIPEYTHFSTFCFRSAVDRVEKFAASLGVTPDTGQWSNEVHRRTLASFETRILLIQYSVWSHTKALQEWGLKQLAIEAMTTVPNLVKKTTLNTSTCHWSEWIIIEESKRALWYFYCLLVKSRHFLHHPVSVPGAITKLSLPCPDALFGAPHEQRWKERKVSCPYPLHNPPPSQKAFFELMSMAQMDQPIVDEAATYTSAILLCSLIDVIHTATTTLSNFATLDAYQQQDMCYFRLRDEIFSVVQYWKTLFWQDPYDLWHRHHPHHKLNSIMLVAHIESNLWRCSDGHPLVGSSYRRASAEVAIEILSGIARVGFIEVKAAPHLKT